MFHKLKILRKILAGITFRNPSRNDIIVFNEASALPLTAYVLKDLHYTLLCEYPVTHESGKIYITFRILFLMLFSLKHLNCNQKLCNLRGIYLLACIKYIKPKVLITTIDNSFAFWWLGIVYKKADFFTIQNGVRPLSHDWIAQNPKHPGSKITITHYFCCGQFEIDLYRSVGHPIKNYYPIGSLSAGIYKFEIFKNKKLEKKYDICKIGQGTSTFPIKTDFLKRVFKMIRDVDIMLAKYSKNNQGSICVALGPSGSVQSDSSYYYPIYEDRVRLVKYAHFYSTYELICESEVIITSMSSAGFEALGYGKKVLFADFENIPTYNAIEYSIQRFPEFEEFCYINKCDYKLFEFKLNRLREMPIEQYSKIIEEVKKYYMNFDPDNPPHKFIRNKIQERLSTEYK